MCGASSHSDELTGDFSNKPEAILIGDHGLSCLLAEKLSFRDLRVLQQYLPIAIIARVARNEGRGSLIEAINYLCLARGIAQVVGSS